MFRRKIIPIARSGSFSRNPIFFRFGGRAERVPVRQLARGERVTLKGEAVRAARAVEEADGVGEIVQNREVVLDGMAKVAAAFAEHGLVANVRLETYAGNDYFHLPPKPQ